MLTTTGQYALRAMATIARADGAPVLARTISDDARVPPAYLSKLLTRLVAGGLLVARRGRGGGFKLAQAPQEITFFAILEAVECAPHQACALGGGACDPLAPCAVHATWKPLAEGFHTWTLETRLSDIS